MTSITVNSKRTNRSITFERNWGASLNEAVELFGENAVFEVFTAAATTRAQSAARNILDNEERSEEDAIRAGMAYVPGQVRARASSKDPFNQLAAKVQAGEITAEELMAELNRRLAQ